MAHKEFIWFILPAIVFVIYSCNNDSDDKAVSQPVSREQQLKSAVAQYPDSLLLTESLIEYYRNIGNYDAAIKLTEEAIKKDSENVELWDINGTLLFEN